MRKLRLKGPVSAVNIALVGLQPVCSSRRLTGGLIPQLRGGGAVLSRSGCA